MAPNIGTNLGRNDESGEQQSALVTGSSNGIGEAIVVQLAKLDYKLVVTGRNALDVTRVADQCALVSPSESKPLEIVADLEDEAQVDRLFELAMNHFENRLTLLVNNAGFGRPVSHEAPDDCYDAFKQIMRINLNAAVRLTLLCAPALRRQAELSGKTSSIVNISSIAGLRPLGPAMAAYGTSKAAMNMFSQSMALDLAPLVRVNCLSPGPIETKIIERSGFSLDEFRRQSSSIAPLGRIGQADEVAQGVLFLADPNIAGFLTGANLILDGGTILSPPGWNL